MFPTSFTLTDRLPADDPTVATAQILERLPDFLQEYRITAVIRERDCIRYEVNYMPFGMWNAITPWLASCSIQVQPRDQVVELTYQVSLITPMVIFAVVFGIVFSFLLMGNILAFLVVVAISWGWLYGVGYYVQSYIAAHSFMRQLKNWVEWLRGSL